MMQINCTISQKSFGPCLWNQMLIFLKGYSCHRTSTYSYCHSYYSSDVTHPSSIQRGWFCTPASYAKCKMHFTAHSFYPVPTKMCMRIHLPLSIARIAFQRHILTALKASLCHSSSRLAQSPSCRRVWVVPATPSLDGSGHTHVPDISLATEFTDRINLAKKMLLRLSCEFSGLNIALSNEFAQYNTRRINKKYKCEIKDVEIKGRDSSPCPGNGMDIRLRCI